MKESINLTKTEHRILKVLWNADEPLSRKDIVEREENLKENTTNVLLKRLLDGGHILIADYIQSGKANARRYSPAISYEEYTAYQLLRNIEGTSFDVIGLIAALIDGSNISDEAINKLEEIVQGLKDRQK